MVKKSQESRTYDDMYQEGGHEGAYDLPYRRSCYYPLYKAVAAELRKRAVRSVLEVGCGAGAFAQMLLAEQAIAYRGFDFSPVAIERASRRCQRSDLFYVADATASESYRVPYEGIVCTEVLEHVEHDVEIIRNWRSGTTCICSVPNFDSDYHVRFFRTKEEVLNRYGGLVAVDSVVMLKKPVLTDISLGSYARAIRWNRYRPARLRDILGFGDFNRVGGWFLFSGTRL